MICVSNCMVLSISTCRLRIAFDYFNPSNLSLSHYGRATLLIYTLCSEAVINARVVDFSDYGCHVRRALVTKQASRWCSPISGMVLAYSYLRPRSPTREWLFRKRMFIDTLFSFCLCEPWEQAIACATRIYRSSQQYCSLILSFA